MKTTFLISLGVGAICLTGGVEKPEKPVADVTSAFDLYVSEIAFDEQKKKSLLLHDRSSA